MTQRFADQPLRDRPHLAVFVYSKPGNFCVATPLLRGLREKYPGCVVDFFGGEGTRQLEEASPLIDARYSLLGRPDPFDGFDDFARERVAVAGPYDLAINVDSDPVLAGAVGRLRPRFVVGRCIDPETAEELPLPAGPLGEIYADHHWNSPAFVDRHSATIDTNFIGEIWARLAYVVTDYHRYDVPVADPGRAVPDILIGTGATRTAKHWPAEHWIEVIRAVRSRGLSIGLLGAPPGLQAQYPGALELDERLLADTGLIDLRGQLSLPQVAGALRVARACIAIDNAIMHLAAAVGTPTLALFGGSPWRLWVPRADHVRLILAPTTCTMCEENRFRNVGCLRERHACMEDITPAQVLRVLDQSLSRRVSAL